LLIAVCSAENPLLPAVAVKDTWNITLHCKSISYGPHCNFLFLLLYFLHFDKIFIKKKNKILYIFYKTPAHENLDLKIDTHKPKISPFILH
jgi:hypothetical protein